jgi:hypothetical protein
MSSTGRKSKRVANDRYITPAWCVRQMVPYLPGRTVLDRHSGGYRKAEWLEPAAGDFAIPLALHHPENNAIWTGIDIEPHDALAHCGDYLQWTAPRFYDLAITNPPFTLAFEFVQKMTRDALIVFALLRLNWLAGVKRNEWLRKNPPNIYVLANRPSFTGGQSDSCDYAWFSWGMPQRPPVILPALTAEERRR